MHIHHRTSQHDAIGDAPHPAREAAGDHRPGRPPAAAPAPSGLVAGPVPSGLVAGPASSAPWAGPACSAPLAGPDSSAPLAGPDASAPLAAPAWRYVIVTPHGQLVLQAAHGCRLLPGQHRVNARAHAFLRAPHPAPAAPRVGGPQRGEAPAPSLSSASSVGSQRRQRGPSAAGLEAEGLTAEEYGAARTLAHDLRRGRQRSGPASAHSRSAAGPARSASSTHGS